MGKKKESFEALLGDGSFFSNKGDPREVGDTLVIGVWQDRGGIVKDNFKQVRLGRSLEGKFFSGGGECQERRILKLARF